MPILNFDNNERKIDWETIIDRMLHEDYALLIGPEAFLAQNSGSGGTDLKIWENSVYKSLNEKKKSIKDAYRNGNITISINDVAPNIVKLLKTRCFKVVITTIIHPFLEKVFDEVWGRDNNGIPNYDIVSFDAKNSQCRRIPFSGRLISSGDYRPLIIYLFGNVYDYSGDPDSDYHKWRRDRESNTIAMNDLDFMKAISFWLQPNGAKHHNLLRNRKLLVLGGKFDDWAFRFLLYALKGFEYNTNDSFESTSDISIPLDRNNASDINLKEYLQSSKIFINDSNLSGFIDNINDKYEFYKQKEKSEREKLNQKDKPDIFLSYASEDYTMANRFYRLLSQRGLKVWMDYPQDEKANIQAFERYKKVIENAIKNSAAFVPILTENTKKALDLDKNKTENKRFFHSVEWQYAQRLGKPIYPIAAGIMDRMDILKVGWAEASPIFWPDKETRMDHEVQVGFLSDRIETLCAKIQKDKENSTGQAKKQTGNTKLSKKKKSKK